MAGPRKGFTKERHSGLKALLTGIGLLGFAGGWAGFSNAHSESVSDGPALASIDAVEAGLETATPTTTRTITPASRTALPAGTPAPASSTTIVPTATVSGAAPKPAATRTPKKSRAS
jgi:hypothetical protein